ncbi:hypothetical protein B7P43_G03317 [Cryptotermes secundus]|uniref:Uncharacterized protein n=1 Tax=Cryptotermes secundus TaxID=105785 RepID=A0A2J7PP12_9NEOP|nr:hypothetical protein B7P43_G03317 [Cryptotermes secundus]
MREAILRVTDADFTEQYQECALVCLSFVHPAFQSAQKHLQENQYHTMSGEFA